MAAGHEALLMRISFDYITDIYAYDIYDLAKHMKISGTYKREVHNLTRNYNSCKLRWFVHDRY